MVHKACLANYREISTKSELSQEKRCMTVFAYMNTVLYQSSAFHLLKVNNHLPLVSTNTTLH